MKQLKNYEKKIYKLLENDNGFFNKFIISLIIINVFVVIIESVESIYLKFEYLFILFEIFTLTVFTFEYIARLFTCHKLSPKYRGIKGKLKYMITPFAIIDLLAISPILLPFFDLDLRFIRIIRLLRLLRMAKAYRYFSAIKSLIEVFNKSKDEFIAIIAMLGLTLIIFSTLVYYAEHEAQPEAFSSIPATMWWGMVTLTTVGYGDISPVTNIGKILASLTSIFGILMFAIPAGLIGGGFVEIYENRRREKRKLQEQKLTGQKKKKQKK